MQHWLFYRLDNLERQVSVPRATPDHAGIPASRRADASGDLGQAGAPRLGSSGVSLTRLQGGGFEAEQQPSPELTFAVLLSGASRPRRNLGDGLSVPRGAENFRHQGGGILTPHGTQVFWQLEGMHDCLVWSIPFAHAESELDSLLPNGAGALYRLCGTVVHDPLFPALSRQLWDHARQSDAIASLYADHAVALLLAQLARLASGAAEEITGWSRRERLAPWRLARAKQFMDANVANDPTLQQVAAAAGLSPHHFLRAFKAETGFTPFQWLQHRRIELATACLRQTEAPLADIALRFGFKNQSHFTVVFRRATGTTPGRMRRDLGRPL